jgi:cytochrome c-type biogenesis protein CcmH/NrfG
VLARESAAALSQARLLVRAEPTAARGWAVLGTVLLTLGQSTEAHDAFERATLLEPATPLYAELLRLSTDPDGIQPILDRYWTTLTL